MAGIIQRAQTRATDSGGDFTLSDDEKKQLLETITELEDKTRDKQWL
mgnify:FL=1